MGDMTLMSSSKCRLGSALRRSVVGACDHIGDMMESAEGDATDAGISDETTEGDAATEWAANDTGGENVSR